MSEYVIQIKIYPTKENELSFLDKEEKVVEYIKLFEKSVEEKIGLINVKFQIIEEMNN